VLHPGGVLEGAVPSKAQCARFVGEAGELLVLAEDCGRALVRLEENEPEVLGGRVVRRECDPGGFVQDARDRAVLGRELDPNAAVLKPSL